MAILGLLRNTFSYRVYYCTMILTKNMYVYFFIDPKRILEDALRDGYVTVSIILCLLLGTAGVGKTSLKHLLTKIRPPEVRQSTPLAKKPTKVNIRPVSGSRVKIKKSDGNWKEATESDLLNLVAEAVLVCNQINDQVVSTDNMQRILGLLEVNSRDTNASPSDETDGPSDKEQSTAAKAKGQAVPDIKPPTKRARTTGVQPQCVQVDTQLHADSGLQHCSPQAAAVTSEGVIASITQKLLQMVTECQGKVESYDDDSKELFASDWVYFTDCGGQPQFHELFPLFIRNTSAILFVIRLLERVNTHPDVEYYRNGERVGIAQKSSLNTIDTLKYLLRSLQSRPTIGSNEEPLKVMVVGTHRDLAKDEPDYFCVSKDNEKMLREVFESNQFSEKAELVYQSQQTENVLFEVDAAHPDADDEDVASIIREEIESAFVAVKEKVPIRWYILELMLRHLAKQLGQGVLSKAQCLEIAHALHISDEAFEAALEFFDKLCIFHYYPDTLPDVVFVNSQVPLDKITELVEYSFLLRHPNEGTSPSSRLRLRGCWQRFKHQGIITLEILKSKCFQGHYVDDLFTPSDFLKLLNQLLVVAPLANPVEVPSCEKATEYFMPSLLEVIPDEELEKNRLFSSMAAPLLVKFSEGCPYAGVFCCLVVYLMKSCQWDVLMRSGKPLLVSRNCVKFQILSSPPCEITLIDSFSYIEIHINVNVEHPECTRLFPCIRQCVLSGIKAACDALHYEESELHTALFCPKHSERRIDAALVRRHTATLTPDNKFWRCDEIENCSGEVEPKHSIWQKAESEIVSSKCKFTCFVVYFSM